MARNVSSSQGLFDDLKFESQVKNDAGAPAPAPTKGKEKKKEAWQLEKDSWKSRMSEKKAFYLTPIVADALSLRNVCASGSENSFSKIVNDALQSYLKEEIDALDVADVQYAGDRTARYTKALSLLMEKKLLGK